MGNCCSNENESRLSEQSPLLQNKRDELVIIDQGPKVLHVNASKEDSFQETSNVVKQDLKVKPRESSLTTEYVN